MRVGSRAAQGLFEAAGLLDAWRRPPQGKVADDELRRATPYEVLEGDNLLLTGMNLRLLLEFMVRLPWLLGHKARFRSSLRLSK